MFRDNVVNHLGGPATENTSAILCVCVSKESFLCLWLQMTFDGYVDIR